MGKPRGRLDIIATPIGNLGDLSPRARQALSEADIVAAEDTRHTFGLLQSIGVARPLVSLHEHNERQRVPELIAKLEAGAVIALVSDAGTPLLSDPGYELVNLAARAGIDVRAIPGPSAITAALAVAGLPTDRFCFEGFLPSRASERRERIASLVDEARTLVFFEAPHRIVECLEDLVAGMGAEREAVIAREITKTHETIYRGTLSQLLERAKNEANLARGEITLVVHGAAQAEKRGESLQLERVVALLAKELPPGKAASLAAQITGARRSDAYALLSREPPADGDV